MNTWESVRPKDYLGTMVELYFQKDSHLFKIIRCQKYKKPGSEPETQALCQLIHRIQPAWVVSFHDPLACIEAVSYTHLYYQTATNQTRNWVLTIR